MPKRKGVRQGDYLMVQNGIFHAVGRANCGAGIMLNPPEHHVTLDLNVMGVHLPQIYRKAECEPIARVDLAAHGFCLTCKGWGLTSMFDHATIDQVLDGKHGDVCPDCGGSGRVGVAISINRVPGVSAEGRVEVDTAVIAVTCKLCRSCYVT